MSRRDIRIVDLGDGAAIWISAGDGADPSPPPPPPRRRWMLWAAGGVGLAALAGSAFALFA
jgi:hypothetical protein